MGKTLYLECNSGISGDMTVAALLDLGAQEAVLKKVLDSMPLSGFEILIRRVKKAGLDVCDFDVKLAEEYENHDHDMEYLYGHMHSHGEYPEHMHNHGEHPEHAHSHGEHSEHMHNHGGHFEHAHSHDGNHAHTHSHQHRGLPQIQEIIRKTDMTERACTIALGIFDILAQAEAKAHGVNIQDVHFHEVGAVDSIVDIVATAVCLDNLDITSVIIPCLCEGRGTVRCQHGILPIPVPAVANIVQANGLKLQQTEVFGELVTPTGAAIAAAIQTGEKLPERFRILKTGMGAGKRTYERPGILRAMLIEPETEDKEDFIYKLETNIDDCTGEILGYLMERLFECGARDVFYTPVYMKKNRPAFQLTIICDKEQVKILEDIIFQETTTIGIRRIRMERRILERETEAVDLSIGKLEVKKCILPNGEVRMYPEYEAAAKLARNMEKPLWEVLDIYKKESDHA